MIEDTFLLFPAINLSGKVSSFREMSLRKIHPSDLYFSHKENILLPFNKGPLLIQSRALNAAYVIYSFPVQSHIQIAVITDRIVSRYSRCLSKISNKRKKSKKKKKCIYIRKNRSRVTHIPQRGTKFITFLRWRPSTNIFTVTQDDKSRVHHSGVT